MTEQSHIYQVPAGIVCLPAMALWLVINSVGCQNENLAMKNKAEGTAFLAENAKQPDVVSLPSGLQYKVLQAGEGDKPALTDIVSVHYEGRLIDGTVFDSSLQRGAPTEFPVNRVISGWTEALQLMAVGSQWELYIPSELAYGPQAAGDKIGPFATLIFKVELLEIRR